MSKQYNYFLNIFHRDISVGGDNQNQLQDNKSPGHFYLMLDSCGKQSFFGKFPKKSDSFNLNQLIGGSQINTFEQEDEHEKLSEYLKQNPSKGVLSTKAVGLKEHEYTSAFNFAVSKCEGQDKEGIYIIGFMDCTDFVQSVYHAAGLPLYFTILYTREELRNLGSPAAHKVLLKYHSRDSFKMYFSDVEALNKEQLAGDLNIGVDKIKYSPLLINSTLPIFRVDIKKVLIEWQSRFGYELSDSEAEEGVDMPTFSANKVNNKMLSNWLSNPQELKNYQNQQMEETKLALKNSGFEDIILKANSTSQIKEDQEFVRKLMQIDNPTNQLQQIEESSQLIDMASSNFNNLSFSNSSQNNDNAWINELVNNSMDMMNNFQNNEEMQKFLSGLSGNAFSDNFNFDDHNNI